MNAIYKIIAICMVCTLFVIPTGCHEPTLDQENDSVLLEVDTLQVTFSIGEELGDSTNTFWSIIAADIDEQGRIFVLDEVDASVKVYNQQGVFLQQVTRRGAGPGELLRPKGITVMGDGSLVITAPSKKGFVVFNSSLEFQEEISLWQNNSPYHVSPLSSNKIVLCRYEENAETDALRQTVGIYNWGSSSCDTMLWVDSIVVTNSEWDRDPSIPLNFCLFHLLSTYGDGHGNVFFGVVDSLQYRVIGWDSTGTEMLNITMVLDPAVKSAEEISADRIYMNTQYHRLGGFPELQLRPYTHRVMIADLGIGPDGNLWVRRGTRLDLFYDIYDFEGNLLRHAVLPQESWSWKTETTPYGILAWELDPLEGYQKLYFIN